MSSYARLGIVLVRSILGLPCNMQLEFDAKRCLFSPAFFLGSHITNLFYFRFGDYIKVRHLDEHEKFRYCVNTLCGWGQIHGWDERRPMYKCKECKTEICYIHDEGEFLLLPCFTLPSKRWECY